MSDTGTLNPPHTFRLGAYGTRDHTWVLEFKHADDTARSMDGWTVEASVQLRNTTDTANLFQLTVWISHADQGQVMVHLPMNHAARIQGTSATGELRAYTQTGAPVVLGTLHICAEEQP